MYARWRPSGGRGEYEIAESHGSITPYDLLGREIVVTRGSRYPAGPTDITLREQGGKLRLRLRRPQRTIHLHRQIRSLLLLPRPRRDDSHLHSGWPVATHDGYILRQLHFADVAFDPDRAVVSLGELVMSNATEEASLTFLDRLARVERIHSSMEAFPPSIRDLLHRHWRIAKDAAPIPRETEEIISLLATDIGRLSLTEDVECPAGTDVLEPLEQLLDLPPLERPDSETLVPVNQISRERLDIRRREAKRWRRHVTISRGAAGAKFRQEVREAYNSTCMVCGLRLPKGEHNSAGVDAAHILPWREFDLDVVANGLCLCKLHHWAFDEQILMIRPEGESGGYRVVLSPLAVEALGGSSREIEEFRKVEGVIPESRLPEGDGKRPHPELLRRLYEEVPPEAVSNDAS